MASCTNSQHFTNSDTDVAASCASIRSLNRDTKNANNSECKNIGFKEENINFSDQTLKSIIDNYCPEQGVRTFEKCLETLPVSEVQLINLFKTSLILSGHFISVGCSTSSICVNLLSRLSKTLIAKLEFRMLLCFPATVWAF